MVYIPLDYLGLKVVFSWKIWILLPTDNTIGGVLIADKICDYACWFLKDRSIFFIRTEQATVISVRHATVRMVCTLVLLDSTVIDGWEVFVYLTCFALIGWPCKWTSTVLPTSIRQSKASCKFARSSGHRKQLTLKWLGNLCIFDLNWLTTRPSMAAEKAYVL
jgi:hypothetical protein